MCQLMPQHIGEHSENRCIRVVFWDMDTCSIETNMANKFIPWVLCGRVGQKGHAEIHPCLGTKCCIGYMSTYQVCICLSNCMYSVLYLQPVAI